MFLLLSANFVGCTLYMYICYMSILTYFYCFCRNGHFLGVAFDNVQYGPGLAYFPAASLSYGESCQMNFGADPFKYPLFFV